MMTFVLRLLAGNASEWTGPTGNNTYLLGGARPALIDAGVGHPDHLAAIAEALGEAPLSLILVTHDHQDHTTGIPPLKERWPALTVRNVPPDTCRDGEIIPAGDDELRAVHTPGHAPDHFCFLHEPTGDLYCGDLARIGGTVVIPASTGGNLRQYLASLRRVLSLAPRRLLPGHGPIVDEPEVLLRQYLQHRQEREDQIVDALRAGCTTIEAIVERVYSGIAPALMRAAAETVRAHLDKLSEEGGAGRLEANGYEADAVRRDER
jgi:glyoxylase-like metal-dependent hydrolase (beta-lactamase superfamily II)